MEHVHKNATEVDATEIPRPILLGVFVSFVVAIVFSSFLVLVFVPFLKKLKANSSVLLSQNHRLQASTWTS